MVWARILRRAVKLFKMRLLHTRQSSARAVTLKEAMASRLGRDFPDRISRRYRP